jgi:uncharacterized protein YuzE
MSNPSPFKVDYDAITDVLYISKRRVPAVKGIEDEFGRVWRYDSNGELIGLTVLDFLDMWNEKKSVLANEISEQFSVSRAQARFVLDHAVHR